jgi:angio-associated migratory cell protein
MDPNMEDLVEVVVSNDPPPDDDDDSVMLNADDLNEEVFDVYGDENGFEGVIEDTVIEQGGNNVVDVADFTFSGHSDSVYCTAIHPSRPGVVLTGGGDDRAFLWTYGAIEGKVGVVSCFELGGHSDTVSSVGFNFDGTLALTGSYDGIVRIWDVATGGLKIQLEGPEDIEWAQWHGKGNAVVAGSRDGTAWMWMALDGACLQVFAGHDGDVSSGCFSGDGKLVCTGGADGTVRLWSPKTGQCKHSFTGQDGFEGMVTTIDSSDDGSLLLAGK